MNEEEKETEEEKPESDSSGEGDKPETTPLLKEARKAREELEKQNDRKEKLLEREEQMMIRQALSGKGDAGTEPVKPKKLTDTEYAEALEKGEVNPLKEDGLI